MKTVQERAYAKLNLTLGVRSRRTDGYHELDMLMQTVDLFDTVSVEKASEITVISTGAFLPYDNTLRRAAEYYRALTGRGAAIRVHKNIPAQAGLGGGSADGAAVLRALDALYGEVDRATLYEIARKVGADVPFCLKGGLCRAEGIGEILTPFEGMKLHTVIVKPERGVSTGELFRALTLPRRMPDTLSAIAAISRKDLPALSRLLFNALEEPAEEQVPEIGEYRRLLLEEGAAGAVMTGSGSAVFGLFENREKAEAAAGKLSHLPFCRVAESV